MDTTAPTIRALELKEQQHRADVAQLVEALTVLLEEAEGFNVSGVYFNEACMGHKGPSLARTVLAKHGA